MMMMTVIATKLRSYIEVPAGEVILPASGEDVIWIRSDLDLDIFEELADIYKETE